jgi:phospholipid/cholesterol/gamma-HCH transport system permease protein
VGLAAVNNDIESNMIMRGLAVWGGLWNRAFELIGGVSYLALDVISIILKGIFVPKVRLGKTAIVTQLVRIGVRSVGIVALVCGCVGFILAMQMEPPLRDFGQTDKIANIIGVAIFRELGPLVAAIVLTGFAGAAIAAEIGTMVVGEEIEALEAHALNPVRFLVVPRVLATTVALTALTVIGDVIAVIAGGVMAVGFLDVPYEVYIANTKQQLVIADFMTGLIKASVFGIILSAIACHNGLRVSGGAAGVGRATTDTVVQAVVAIIIADLVFTLIFYSIGWT